MSQDGYTFLGRYYEVDRSRHLPAGQIWTIRDVFDRLGGDITDALDIGCSVGINDVIAAVENPTKNFIGIDINPSSIETAISGKWNFQGIMPSGMAMWLPCSEETLVDLYKRFCNPEYFEIDTGSKEVRLIKPVENIKFECQDGKNTNFPDNSFDFILSYMVAGMPWKNLPVDMHDYIGFEIERILRNGKYLWHQEGLFRLHKEKGGSGLFYRMTRFNGGVDQESDPTYKSKLFAQRIEPSRSFN